MSPDEFERGTIAETDDGSPRPLECACEFVPFSDIREVGRLRHEEDGILRIAAKHVQPECRSGGPKVSEASAPPKNQQVGFRDLRTACRERGNRRPFLATEWNCFQKVPFPLEDYGIANVSVLRHHEIPKVSVDQRYQFARDD